jgi:hypothetical protein
MRLSKTDDLQVKEFEERLKKVAVQEEEEEAADRVFNRDFAGTSLEFVDLGFSTSVCAADAF